MSAGDASATVASSSGSAATPPGLVQAHALLSQLGQSSDRVATAQVFGDILSLVTPLEDQQHPLPVRSRALLLHGLATLRVAGSPPTTPAGSSGAPSPAPQGGVPEGHPGISAQTQADAVQLLQQACKLDPGNMHAWDELGVALYGQGDLLGARACFEGAVQAGGGAEHLGRLSTVLRGLAKHVGQRDAAEALVAESVVRAKEAVAVAPGNPTALQALGNGYMTQYTTTRTLDAASRSVKAYQMALKALSSGSDGGKGGEGGVRTPPPRIPADEQVALYINCGQMLRAVGERERGVGMFRLAAKLALEAGDTHGKASAVAAWGESVRWVEGAAAEVSAALRGQRRQRASRASGMPPWYVAGGSVALSTLLEGGGGAGAADTQATVVTLESLVSSGGGGGGGGDTITAGRVLGQVAASGDGQDPTTLVLGDGRAAVGLALYHMRSEDQVPHLRPSDVVVVLAPRVTVARPGVLRRGAEGAEVSPPLTLLHVYEAREVLVNGSPLRRVVPSTAMVDDATSRK